MKKYFMTLAAVLCCAMTTTVFTACGSDDDDPKNPADDTTPAAAVMDYSLTVGDDMVNMLDLTVEYYDANGKVQSEPMTQKTWTKNVKAQLPATLGVRLKIQMKSSVNTATLEKFTESYTYSYSVYPVTASGQQLEGGKTSASSMSLDIPGSKLTEWAEDHANGLVKFLYVFDTKGQPTSSSWQQ